MTTEIEDMLVRELDAVAGGIEVPPMPSVVTEAGEARTSHVWQPLLVAAAVVLIVGVVALALSRQGDGEPQPAPSGPSPTTGSPSPGRSDARIPVTPPTVPYVLDQVLYVDGQAVPGAWQGVQSRDGVWLAQQFDQSWWWGGPGVEPSRIEAELEQPPVLSPDGRYIAFLDRNGDPTPLTGFTTGAGGEGFGAAPVEISRSEDGVLPSIRAVTDDGDVIVQGTRTSILWHAQDPSQAVVDLSATAADQVVLQGTAAGLVVVDGSDGATDATGTAPYLATVSADGALTRTGTLPTYDALAVSPGGSRLVRSPAGTLGGEVASVDTLLARPVAGGDETTLAAPAGWAFAVNTWAWEDETILVAVLVPSSSDGRTAPRMARCDVELASCRELRTRDADTSTDPSSSASTGAAVGTSSAEEALTAVVEAVVADDRAGLADQAVVADGEWAQLVDYAAGGGVGEIAPCRANGGGTFDCEIPFEASPSTTYYAIVEPAGNAYGWRISYVGVGGA
ncbi:hypothetical protein H5V45_10050 [Nocardioides sp. KIGAM211]|uniref:WD40-like Beta Propeller Repeat n=1 Tax=Nocardioides luti TaxID=2761101 RepID=A0A7X0RG25_9ACTN|nr:hypothetical protein [Nocardioides luti]MBB6627663.1 hypothetical protein [Nocardioides luti]